MYYKILQSTDSNPTQITSKNHTEIYQNLMKSTEIFRNLIFTLKSTKIWFLVCVLESVTLQKKLHCILGLSWIDFPVFSDQFTVRDGFFFQLIMFRRFTNITKAFRSSTCPLTGFFWLLSHVIYLKLTRVLKECLLSQS